MTAISASSTAASSSRAPWRYNTTDSRRCLIIFWRTSVTSASSSVGAVPVRSSMSRFLTEEWMRRRVPTPGLSPLFMAVTRAVLRSSLIMAAALKQRRAVDHPAALP